VRGADRGPLVSAERLRGRQLSGEATLSHPPRARAGERDRAHPLAHPGLIDHPAGGHRRLPEVTVGGRGARRISSEWQEQPLSDLRRRGASRLCTELRLATASAKTWRTDTGVSSAGSVLIARAVTFAR